MFGEVVKTSMLGTDAVVVECDNGSLKVVCGEKLLDEVVEISSSKDGRGLQKALPVDIKMIGPKVLESFGVNEQTRAALFQKSSLRKPLTGMKTRTTQSQCQTFSPNS